MKLNFSYDLSAARILRDEGVYSRLAMLRRAGVGNIWITGYFYGKYQSSPEDIRAARSRLLDEGFETGIINVPLGHGGNALDPDNPDFDISIGAGWHMTMDAMGRMRENTTCIDQRVIADTLAANQAFYDMGYRRIFNDDDLRLGQWGQNIQGCYCERCMAEFRKRVGRNVTRTEIASGADVALTEAWLAYQCEKIPQFLSETTPSGMSNGIMVMHNGDRRHGIDIPLLRRTMPDNFLFRVGEGHFDDSSFATPEQRDSIARSIRRHMALVGNEDICFSETTVFPKFALSPDNWIEKMRIEIGCGLRNLFLMSGEWFFADEYWKALIAALPELRELAEVSPLPTGDMPEFSWIW